MREILFRGKGDKKYNTGEWYEGVPIQDYDGVWQICNNLSKRVVIPETVGQSTGRRAYDKEGQEKTIFEKDICEVTVFDHNGSDKQYICSVEELGGGFAFVNEKENFYYNLTDFEDTESDVVIIGNIHDNPELLRSESK